MWRASSVARRAQGVFGTAYGSKVARVSLGHVRACHASPSDGPSAVALPSVMRAMIAEDGKLVCMQRPVPQPKAGEVLVRVHATGVNRADTLQRNGRYPVPKGHPDVLGLELAGTVVSVGADAGKKVNAGDKVMALLDGGGYAEYAVVPVQYLMPVPQGWSMADAAAVPEQWLTAYQLLFMVSDARAGDTVLVHAAGSGVGTALIQIAKEAGMRVLATAGTAEKLGTARALGAEEDGVFNYKEMDWAAGVKEASGERGVQVVLDPVGGSYAQGNLDVLCVDGRWTLYGLMGGVKAERNGPILAKMLGKRINLRATTLRSRSLEYKADLIERFTEDVLPKLQVGAVRPIHDKRSFSLEDAQASHEYMEANKNVGKVILHVLE